MKPRRYATPPEQRVRALAWDLDDMDPAETIVGIIEDCLDECFKIAGIAAEHSDEEEDGGEDESSSSSSEDDENDEEDDGEDGEGNENGASHQAAEDERATEMHMILKSLFRAAREKGHHTQGTIHPKIVFERALAIGVSVIYR